MVGHEIWRETLKKVQNEKHTIYDLEYGEKFKKYTLQDLDCVEKTEKKRKM